MEAYKAPYQAYCPRLYGLPCFFGEGRGHTSLKNSSISDRKKDSKMMKSDDNGNLLDNAGTTLTGD